MKEKFNICWKKGDKQFKLTIPESDFYNFNSIDLTIVCWGSYPLHHYS